jgi:hypothetical protein
VQHGEHVFERCAAAFGDFGMEPGGAFVGHSGFSAACFGSTFLEDG